MTKIWKKKHAFTVAEIMVVVMIIAVVASSTIGISKIRADYMNKFMYYSTFTSLKKAVSELITEGFETNSGGGDDDIVTKACPDGTMRTAYTSAQNLSAQASFDSWKAAWVAMKAQPKLCSAGPNDCTIAQANNDSAAAFFNAKRSSPNLNVCTSQYWASTTCGNLTYNASSDYECTPTPEYSLFDIIVGKYEALSGALQGQADCINNGQPNCDVWDNMIYDAQKKYENTVIDQNRVANLPEGCRPMPMKSGGGVYLESERNCIPIDSGDDDTDTGSGGSGGGTQNKKMLPDTALAFFTRFANMINSIGTTNASFNTKSEPFTNANANIILPNGIRLYNFGSEAIAAVPADPTGMNDYFIIYADIDGSKRSGKVNDDVMAFKIYRSGVVVPYTPTAPSTKYLSASVKYKDASGKIQWLERNVPYLDAACHSGYATGDDCQGKTKAAICNTFACGEPVINKPGF